jgi:hypothetical protein
MRRPQILILALLAIAIGASASPPAAAVPTTRMLLRTDEYQFLRREIDMQRAEERAQAVSIHDERRRQFAAMEARFESAARVSDDYWEVRFAVTDIYQLVGRRSDLLASLPEDAELSAAAGCGGIVRLELPTDELRRYMAHVRYASHELYLKAEQAGVPGEADARRYLLMTKLFNEQQTLNTIQNGYINLNRQMVDLLVEINQGPLMARLAAAANQLHLEEVRRAHNEL